MVDDQAQTPSSEATSLDGRSFFCRIPLDSQIVVGDLVVMAAPSGLRALGQLRGKRPDGAEAFGEGTVLGALGGADEIEPGITEAFAGAAIEEASAELSRALEDRMGASMPVGTSRGAEAHLRPSGINRHTFLCGQSGSGKSYALGVLLEQILLDTELPLIVLDPNADFVHLGTPVEGAPADDVRRLGEIAFQVLRPQADADLALRSRFIGMNQTSQAAVLRVDPLADREEYNEFLRFGQESSPTQDAEVAAHLLASDEPYRVALGKRMQNLGVLEWDVWARKGVALVDRLESEPARARILDLSGFTHPEERLVVALDLLDHLWANRERREPVMVVIDEAHNVCSADPKTPLEHATTARLVQIAAEGRKYGIWLFLCTQRPGRMPQPVLSQCDNLVLMRMNSRGDLAQIQEVFGFVPDDMVATAPFFRQGECLMAGSFIPVPSFVQVARRRTREGGSDVAVPL